MSAAAPTAPSLRNHRVQTTTAVEFMLEQLRLGQSNERREERYEERAAMARADVRPEEQRAASPTCVSAALLL